MAGPLKLAAASAAGTTVGAPTPLSMGPPPGMGNPTDGPPTGNPPVAPHAGVKSVGTHPPAQFQKKGNPTFGMSKS